VNLRQRNFADLSFRKSGGMHDIGKHLVASCRERWHGLGKMRRAVLPGMEMIHLVKIGETEQKKVYQVPMVRHQIIQSYTLRPLSVLRFFQLKRQQIRRGQ